MKDLIPNVAIKLMLGDPIPGYESYQEKMAPFPTTPISDQRRKRHSI